MTYGQQPSDPANTGLLRHCQGMRTDGQGTRVRGFEPSASATQVEHCTSSFTWGPDFRGWEGLAQLTGGRTDRGVILVDFRTDLPGCTYMGLCIVKRDVK